MKSVLAVAALSAVAFAEGPSGSELNQIVAGTYDFEIMGRPHRLYVCDADNNAAEGADEKRAMYWSIFDRTKNEYAVALGRDYDGVEYDGKQTYVSRCDIFKLYGERVLQGYYELTFNADTLAFTLRERFPEFEDLQADAPEVWNEYELVKLSPAIVGNPDLEGFQCFHPLGNVVYQMPLPSLWESDFLGLDNGHRYRLIAEDALTSCWKLENEFDDIMQAGYYYGYDFEWDGSLLITSFDSVNKNAGCSVGTSFIVIVDEDLAIASYQCEDGITGRTYLTHLTPMTKNKEDYMCPYPVTPFAVDVVGENSITNVVGAGP